MIKSKLKGIIQFILNPRLLLCFGLAWIITNGWSYIMLGVGTYLDIGWMIAISGAYLAFLWLPITPEKIVTIAIAIVILRILFPNDQKTLAVLKSMREKIKESAKSKKKKKKAEEDEDHHGDDDNDEDESDDDLNDEQDTDDDDKSDD